MEITVYHSQNSHMPNAVECVSTPIRSGWDWTQVGFERHGGEWALDIRTREEDEWEHMFLLQHGCERFDDYERWLSENVLRIEVNADLFWEPVEPADAGESSLFDGIVQSDIDALFDE